MLQMAEGFSPIVLVGSNNGPARFGSSVVVGGDLDQNGFDEVIVGAPHEEYDSESSGVVYVYYVTINGLSEDRKQVGMNIDDVIGYKAFILASSIVSHTMTLF